MNKKIHLRASFILTGGVVSVSHLHNWGLDWDWSLILGFGFITFLWLGLEWTIKNAFGK